ncbi:hypothetical protein ACOMHN_008305 [Nucella lapillus]
MVLLEGVSFFILFIGIVVLSLTVRPKLDSAEGVVIAVLLRIAPLDFLVAYLLWHTLHPQDLKNELDHEVHTLTLVFTIISLLMSSIGDSLLVAQGFFFPGMFVLGLARFVSLKGLMMWRSVWAGVNPSFSAFLRVMGKELGKKAFEVLLGLYSDIHSPYLFLRAAIFFVLILMFSWRLTRCIYTSSYSFILLCLATQQIICWVACTNVGTVLGAWSGVLFVLSHLPLILFGSEPMSYREFVFLYYLAQGAYTMSAVHATISSSRDYR